MPTWAVGVIVGVVVSTGGYVLRMLLKISQTLGNIDAKLDSHGDRLRELESALPRGPRWTAGETL